MLGAGVLIRLATEDVVVAVERARGGRDFRLDPERSHKYTEPDRPVAEDEVYVVTQAYVDFVNGDDDAERWVSYEHHGSRVTVVDDATLELLKLADRTAREDLVEDLLSDMRIAGLGVSRRELMSATRWTNRQAGSMFWLRWKTLSGS